MGWSLDLTLHLVQGTQRLLSKWIKYIPGILSPLAVDPMLVHLFGLQGAQI